MGTALPPALGAAIAALNVGIGGHDLSERAKRQSERYRAQGDSTALATRADAAAYAAVRMPATYAASAAALRMLAQAATDLAPRSILDAACGAGSAAFAALERFPGVTDVCLIDRNPCLLDAARALAETSGLTRARRLEARIARLETAELPAADLVTLSYALVEMREAEAIQLSLRLFAAAGQALLLVEPGSRAGFARIRAARQALISAGARIVGPCTHQERCPLESPDWCHFSVRLARSRHHLRAKGASLPYEDEPYSCLLALRGASADMDGLGRILAPPQIDKSGAIFRCCGRQGVVKHQIRARDPGFRAARKLGWGDCMALQDGQPQD